VLAWGSAGVAKARSAQPDVYRCRRMVTLYIELLGAGPSSHASKGGSSASCAAASGTGAGGFQLTSEAANACGWGWLWVWLCVETAYLGHRRSVSRRVHQVRFALTAHPVISHRIVCHGRRTIALPRHEAFFRGMAAAALPQDEGRGQAAIKV
jgi:hypothetical protein